VEPLSAVPDRFFSLLDYREEFVHGNLGIILVKSEEKPGFQVNSRINRAIKEAPEPVKGYPLENANE